MMPSKALVAGAIAFIAGIAAGSVGLFLWGAILAIFLLGLIFLVPGGFGQKTVLLAALVLIFFSFGFARAFLSPLTLPTETAGVFSVLRTSLVESSGMVIGGEEHAMFSAMVLGDKSLLSDQIKDNFSVTGTRHILAISGMHLSIVAVVFWQLLISAGFWRRQAFWGSLLAILVFVFLVGMPPSAVRAGIMAALYLLARHIGRPSQSWRLLVLAAAVMLLADPGLLFYSIGFQLSFLAVLGIIFFMPFFERLLSFIRWDFLRSLISVSLSAQITTWPLIASYFGIFSVVGVFANLVIVPLLPLVMILGLGFLAFGWVGSVFAKIFLWPIWAVLNFVNDLVFYLSRLPFASIEISSFGLAILTFYYLAILVFLLAFRKYATDEI